MLTRKQHELLMYIDQQIRETGVSPSFDEMKDALDLASKSGIHRLITALEERGFVRRLPHRARALEILRLPAQAAPTAKVTRLPTRAREPANDVREIPFVGRIAAGIPIEALENDQERVPVPESLLGRGDHYVLEIKGDSMIDAHIMDGDQVVIRKAPDANSGDIVVAVVGEEATLKRLRKKGGSIALEPANARYETRIYGPDQVEVRGKLVGLIRRYH